MLMSIFVILPCLMIISYVIVYLIRTRVADSYLLIALTILSLLMLSMIYFALSLLPVGDNLAFNLQHIKTNTASITPAIDYVSLAFKFILGHILFLVFYFFDKTFCSKKLMNLKIEEDDN